MVCTNLTHLSLFGNIILAPVINRGPNFIDRRAGMAVNLVFPIQFFYTGHEITKICFALNKNISKQFLVLWLWKCSSVSEAVFYICKFC